MIRVASYCRVSTDSEDQANSFESQQRYFREYIEHHPDWELYAVYADEGVTGTSTKKRIQFNKMMDDAYAKKFGLILTKEVSRFSRNLLDTIAYTRELKQLGIGVIFMNDGFSTLDPDAELRLSIMGSIAQEESRKTSSRVKWGQSRRMEQGVVFGPSLLGYDVRDGKLTVNPEGAQIVKLIFHKYGVEKKGSSVIARELREAGIRTSRQSTNWSSSHIVKILHNEKYVGDLVQKKTITPDYLSHRKIYNRGEEEKIIIRNHHEPIVDRKLWELVQAELQNRNAHRKQGTRPSNRYIFSGKIICGCCGGKFTARHKTRKNGTSFIRWCCRRAVTEGCESVDAEGRRTGCGIGKTIRDNLALECFTEALSRIPADFDFAVSNLANVLRAALRSCDGLADEISALERRIQHTTRKKEALIDAYTSGLLAEADLIHMNQQYDRELTMLRARLKEQETKCPDLTDNRRDFEGMIRTILSNPGSAYSFCRAMLQKAVIHQDGTIALHIHHIPQVWYFQLDYHNKSP